MWTVDPPKYLEPRGVKPVGPKAAKKEEKKEEKKENT
jgi:hypothetical protein